MIDVPLTTVDEPLSRHQRLAWVRVTGRRNGFMEVNEMRVDEALDKKQASAACWGGHRRRPAATLAIGPAESSNRAEGPTSAAAASS